MPLKKHIKKHIISEIVFDENGNEISKDAFIVDIAKEKENSQF